MPSKKHRPEEIIGKLREAEVVLAQGATTCWRRSPNCSSRVGHQSCSLAKSNASDWTFGARIFMYGILYGHI